MRAIMLLFLSFVAVNSGEIDLCNITCEPDDEFVDSDLENVSDEWDNFMETANAITFTDFVLNCQNNEEQTVDTQVIYDELWKLRFQVYNERQNGTGKTLNDCYCEFQDQCKTAEFRACMASARVSMLTEFSSLATEIIRDMIAELSQQC